MPESTPENEPAELSAVGSIGFLGLGIMGSRMAANIARAGFPLAVWTHTPGKAERWASEHGASAYATPAEVAEHSDVVLSMVVDGEQVAGVLLGEHGVIDAARPGLLCVDMSTIGPVDTRRIGAALGERGVAMLDAPVTGSSPRAEDGHADDHGRRRARGLPARPFAAARRWAASSPTSASSARARCSS